MVRKETAEGTKVHERENRLTLGDFVERAPDLSKDERMAILEILGAVSEGARDLARRLSLGPLHGLTGSSGQVNVQGEEVQAFDEIAQEIFSGLLGASGRVSLLVSEEREHPEVFPCLSESFHVAMDPLDGSSNLSVSGPVGSIFALYRGAGLRGEDPSRDFLESTREVVCAAYVLYSVSTLLVVAFRDEVRMYALDPSSGHFLPLPGPVRFPDGGGQIVSINTGNYTRWELGVRQYVDALHGRPAWSARYVGALVMDFHRNLLKGGIYLYPGDLPKGGAGHPEGKLRLLFEAIPMAFIARAAGGLATNGHRPILEIPASHIHQRVALVVGSRERVTEYSHLSGSPDPV